MLARCLEEKLAKLDNVLKSRDNILSTKSHIVKAIVFPVVMYGCESWIIEEAREFQKDISFCFIDTLKPLTVWIKTNWKILKEMGIPDHLICLLRNLYAGQEATVRTRHGTTDCFKIGKGVHLGYMLSLCLCRVHHVKCQAGWSTSWKQDYRRNINNFRYTRKSF